jgi:hypothetical protein
MDENRKDPLKEFENRWKDWVKKTPGTAPEEAARRVMVRLPERSRRWNRLGFLPAPRYLAAAAAVALLILGIRFWGKTKPTAVEAPVVAEASIELGGDVALIWLDPDTPLYLTLNPPEAVRGESP